MKNMLLLNKTFSRRDRHTCADVVEFNQRFSVKFSSLKSSFEPTRPKQGHAAWTTTVPDVAEGTIMHFHSEYTRTCSRLCQCQLPLYRLVDLDAERAWNPATPLQKTSNASWGPRRPASGPCHTSFDPRSWESEGHLDVSWFSDKTIVATSQITIIAVASRIHSPRPRYLHLGVLLHGDYQRGHVPRQGRCKI